MNRICFLAGLLFAIHLAALPASANELGPLVDAAWLKQHLADRDLLIIEVADTRASYDKEHIPGAIYLHWVDDVSSGKGAGQYNVLDQQAMQRLMRKLGAQPTSQIVIYDNLGTRCAARLYWMMKHYQHAGVSILNGGKAAWKRAGYAFSTDSQAPRPSQYVVKGVRKGLIADKTKVLQAVADQNTKLIDGRSVAQFEGAEVGRVYHTGDAHQRKGHVKGAVNIFWRDNFNKDGTFKSVAQLRSLYEQHGIKRGESVITYCNEGLHAAPPWFVLQELLQFEDVRVYDRSMAEWANEKSTPMQSSTDQ